MVNVDYESRNILKSTGNGKLRRAAVVGKEQKESKEKGLIQMQTNVPTLSPIRCCLND